MGRPSLGYWHGWSRIRNPCGGEACRRVNGHGRAGLCWALGKRNAIAQCDAGHVFHSPASVMDRRETMSTLGRVTMMTGYAVRLGGHCLDVLHNRVLSDCAVRARCGTPGLCTAGTGCGGLAAVAMSTFKGYVCVTLCTSIVCALVPLCLAVCDVVWWESSGSHANCVSLFRRVLKDNMRTG